MRMVFASSHRDIYSLFGIIVPNTPIECELRPCRSIRFRYRYVLMLAIICNWHRLHIRLQAHAISAWTDEHRYFDCMAYDSWKWKLLFCCRPTLCAQHQHNQMNVTSKANTRADLHLNLLLQFAAALRLTWAVRPFMNQQLVNNFKLSPLSLCMAEWARERESEKVTVWQKTTLLLMSCSQSLLP